MPQNLYSILGLEWGAEAEQVKAAYRQLAKTLHPDLNPEDPEAGERFKEIVAAYWVLSDSSRRVAYLRDHGVGSILENAARRPPREARPGMPQTGQDIVVRLNLSLEEIAVGIVKKVKVRRQCNCSACGGSGYQGGKPESACPACHGSGSVPDLLRLRRGVKDAMMACRKCEGRGTVKNNSCPTCGGRRRDIQDHYVSIGVPAGVEDRHKMVIRGQGHEGFAGGEAGDLKVIIQQKPHPYFERRGADLIYMCPITIVQWLEGDELRLPALNGEVRLKISPGLKSEGTLKVASRGLAKADGSRGDLLIQYRLFMPKRLSKKQSLLLKRLEELPGFSPAQDEKGFFPRSA